MGVVRKLLFLSCAFFANALEAKNIKQIKHKRMPAVNKLPIVTHEYYDIGMLGLEKLHPFDTKKYGKVYEYLLNQSKLRLNRNRFYSPEPVSDKDLLLVHTQDYLKSLYSSTVIAAIAEMPPLSYVPNFLLRNSFLTPMRYATGGTVLAAQLALHYGWAINLSGGYHHAKSNQGGGFCFFADIPLAIRKLKQAKPDLKVLIVDLDAHQGNGHEAICGPDDYVSILDIYNGYIYPQDHAAKRYIDFNYPVYSHINDHDYMKLLQEALPKAIETCKPNFIIYNAGTDVYSGDPLGKMDISQQGIIERDAFVFKIAREQHIPIVMVLSGGYTKQSADIIGCSIEHILADIIGISR